MISKLLSMAVLILGANLVFAQAPANNDGSAKGSRSNRTDPAVRFKELDKNNDGKLSLDELSVAQFGRTNTNSGSTSADASGGTPAVSLADHFKTSDANSDGSLSVEEFTSLMKTMHTSGNGKSGGKSSGSSKGSHGGKSES